MVVLVCLYGYAAALSGYTDRKCIENSHVKINNYYSHTSKITREAWVMK